MVHGERKEENQTKIKKYGSIQHRIYSEKQSHFKFQKEVPFLQMSNGVFRQKCFPIRQQGGRRLD